MEFLGVDIRTIVLAIVTVTNGILATLIYLRSKVQSSVFFVVAIVSTSLWSFGIMMYTQPGVTALTRFFSNFNYTTSSVIAVSFFFFAFYLGTEDRRISQRFKAGTIAFLILVFFFIQIPNQDLSVIGEITLVGEAKKEVYGFGYIFYLLLLVGYFVGGLVILLKKFVSSTGIFRNQLVYILLGTSIAITLGVITNIVFPNAGLYGYEWIGPIGTLIMVSFIFYAVTRHKLWNFRILAIQFFVALMVLTMLLQIFVANNFLEQLVRGTIFFITFAFSIFLIKNLLQEVEDREKMERLTNNLYEANKRLQIIDVEKSDFVSITSHQFRTPLTIIKGYTSMLLEGSFGSIRNEKQTTALDKIYQASQRLVLTIEEFLNISRIEQSQMAYTPEKTELRNLVGQVIKSITQTLTDVNLKLVFNAPLSDNFYTRIDPAKTRLVITNIIDNSIKYTPAGGKIKVTLEKKHSTKTILLSVEDNGIGMNKSMLNRLFEKFSRGENISKLHTEGRGLGLYIARQIIQSQGGRIWAESPGKDMGSTFYIEFPDWDHEMQRKEIKDFVESL